MQHNNDKNYLAIIRFNRMLELNASGNQIGIIHHRMRSKCIAQVKQEQSSKRMILHK